MRPPNHTVGSLYLVAAALFFFGAFWSAWVYAPAAVIALVARKIDRRDTPPIK